MDLEINPPDGYFARILSLTQLHSTGMSKEQALSFYLINKVLYVQSNKEQDSNPHWEALYLPLEIDTISKFTSIKVSSLRLEFVDPKSTLTKYHDIYLGLQRHHQRMGNIQWRAQAQF